MKKLHFTFIRFFILSALFVIGAYGNTVSLDTSFNGTGYNIPPNTPAPGRAISRSMSVQSDGKIVVGGYTLNQTPSPDKFALTRFNSDGTLDNSFGNGGSVITTIDNFNIGVKVLILPDDKILLGGTSSNNDSYQDFTVIRYNNNGSLDTSFNNVGYVTQTFNNLSTEELNDMVLQSDGKIVLVGRTMQVGGPQNEFNVAVMRLNTDGSLDTTFNGTGQLIIGTQNAWEEAHSVFIQPDGKILIGGGYTVNRLSFLLIRLNSDGTLDQSFGNAGTTITNIVSEETLIITIDLQSDGKILAGGRETIARYTTNGILDTSFATNGFAEHFLGLDKIKVLSNDKFLASSEIGPGRFIRYMKNGARDTNLNAFISFPGYSCLVGSFAIQSDGKLVQGGYCDQGNNSSFAVFRVQENRTKRYLDFNGDSITDIAIYRPSNGQWRMLYGSTQTVAGYLGTETDRPVPADFTGDGRTDLAIYRPSTGEWIISRSDDGTFHTLLFGLPDDIPVPADYDGDNIADVAVFRPSTNVWYILQSTGGVSITTFGLAGDKPVPADYDGDFITDIAIYRPSNGVWWIQKSSDESIYAFQFGTSTDIPVQGDYTGDNLTDAAFWRPSTGEWFILRSEDYSYFSVPFGLSDDLPTPGNFTGDSRFDIVVYRPSTNTWHIQPMGGSYFYKEFGESGDKPIPNTFVP